MRRKLFLALALVVALVVVGGCSSSPPSVMSDSSPFNKVPDTTTSIPAAGTDSGGATSTSADRACSLVSAADVTAAGVPGQISEGTASEGAGVPGGTSDCMFSVSAHNSSSTFDVRLEPGSKAAFDRGVASTSNAQLAVVVTPVAGLGTEAAVRTTTIKSENKAFDRDVFVLHGTTLIDIAALADTATTTELVALARRVDAKLG